MSIPDIVLYGVAVVLPSAAFATALALPRWISAIGRWFHRPELVTSGPPIEQLSADLRRLHRILRDPAPSTPILRWRATRLAYDTLLTQACDAVEVTHRLDELPPEGFEREMERLRVEEALRTAGLMVP